MSSPLPTGPTLVPRGPQRPAGEWLAAWARRRPGAALALGLGTLALVALLLRGGSPAPGAATAEVQQGRFSVSLVESGTLQALRSISYASTIQSNQAKIVALVPEGKLVAKGDLLILFDAAPFEEEIRKSQAMLQQAEADLAKARQELGLQGITNQEDLAAARQKSERSRLELRDVQEGKGKLKEEEADAEVANAERELQKAVTAHADLLPLLEKGFITRLELDRAAQLVEKSREELALARRRRESLQGFGRPLELSQAQADALASQQTLKQLESAAGLRLASRGAAIAAAESRVQEASAKLALARQQLSRTEVRADVPGIVVYRDVFFGSEQRKPQVGDQVWANQPLLILPDVSQMVVETRVREIDIHKVANNQRAAIRVSAYPDLRLSGKVSLIGTLALEERERKGTKYFGITVKLDQSDARLRPGMTARVEVQVEQRERALYLPVDAVHERDGKSFVFVAGVGRPELREVGLGPSNADFVVVESGLRAGERVLLRDPAAPPSDFGGAGSR